jgi:hypothetical protein
MGWVAAVVMFLLAFGFYLLWRTAARDAKVEHKWSNHWREKATSYRIERDSAQRNYKKAEAKLAQLEEVLDGE